MQEVTLGIEMDAETYRKLEILAEITDMTLEGVVIAMLDFAVKLHEDEIAKYRNNEKFNQFREDI